MFKRTLFLVGMTALFASPAALACGGENCANPNCQRSQSPAPTPLPEDGSRVTLSVQGMTCGGCSSKVKAVLMGIDGVTGAQVDHADGQTIVAYDEDTVEVDAIKKAISELGYTVSEG